MTFPGEHNERPSILANFEAKLLVERARAGDVAHEDFDHQLLGRIHVGGHDCALGASVHPVAHLQRIASRECLFRRGRSGGRETRQRPQCRRGTGTCPSDRSRPRPMRAACYRRTPAVAHHCLDGSVTTPPLPSTVMTSPLWMRCVATPVPRTAGTPYSRATIELWLSGPPTSVTTAAARANSGVQAGVVIAATSTSPCFI